LPTAVNAVGCRALPAICDASVAQLDSRSIQYCKGAEQAMYLDGFRMWLGAAALVALTIGPAANAQTSWPTNTVKIVVPYPPGGGADGLPRALTDGLSKMWGQAVIIENKAGANGNVGTESVTRAAPDGYTLLSGPTPVFAVNFALYKKLNYDPTTLKPIVLLGRADSALSVHPSLGVGSVKELIAKAKAEPGQITYASQGNGSTSHLTAAWFESVAGIKLNHVPYRGSGPAMADHVGGHVKMMFDNLASTMAQHKGGKVQILAICAEKRSPFLPEAMTMIEAGVPDFLSYAWFAVAAPAGTPDAIIEKVNKDINTLLATDEIKRLYAALGSETIGGSVERMAKFVDQQAKHWAGIIKTAHIPQVE
jgi:tripartite-type tricarboxylate transporter receptor subunit TctC